jgi:mannosyl-3-phosphoglycerate phosphatase
MQKLFFTDLDDLIIDSKSCSFRKSMPAVNKIRNKVPLIICSSKTRAEIEHIRSKLKINDPFISENGGAVFIPKSYFDFDFDFDKKIGEYLVIQLGTDYVRIRNLIDRIKMQGIPLKCFGDMSANDIRSETGIPLPQAKFAKMREYDEPFRMFKDDEKDVMNIVHKNNLRCFKGRNYYHITGENDRKKAMRILMGLYKRKYGRVRTAGFGYSNVHFDILSIVDEPYLMMNHDKTFACKKFKRVGCSGVDGWCKAVNIALRN